MLWSYWEDEYRENAKRNGDCQNGRNREKKEVHGKIDTVE